jgi:hypothetical protein
LKKKYRVEKAIVDIDVQDIELYGRFAPNYKNGYIWHLELSGIEPIKKHEKFLLITILLFFTFTKGFTQGYATPAKQVHKIDENKDYVVLNRSSN